MKRVLFNLGLACLGVFAALLLIEAGYRLLARQARSAARDDRPRLYYMPENAATLQDHRYAWQPAEDAYRIAVVGDSFTFAPYMQFDDAFPKRLERMLNLNSGVRPVEVLNLGVPGVSTIHEAKTVEQALQRGAQLVILQVTLNDLQEKPFSRRELEWAERFGPLRLSGALKRVTRYWQSLGYLLQRLHNLSTRPAYIAYYQELLKNPANRAQVEQGLDRIAALAAARDRRVVAVIFPIFGVPLGKDYPFRPLHDYFAEQLAVRGIPALDLLQTFAGIPQERLLVMPGKDLHPGEIAHRLAAEGMYRWLAAERIIPAEFAIRREFRRRTTLLPRKRAARKP